MKNGKIIVAAAILMSAASFAGAQDVKVDFDGKTRNEGTAETMRGVFFNAVGSDTAEKKTEEAVVAPEPKPAKEAGAIKVEEKSLAEILSGLSAAQKLVFFESLTFNKDGKLSGFYSKDIKKVLGEKAFQEVLKKFGIKYEPTRSTKDEWCVSQGTCGYSPGYSCTDNC